MLLELNRINLPAGQRIYLTNVDWQEYEAILNDFGENRHSKITYQNNTLEIMSPLPEHERKKELISDFVKVILEELEIDFLTLGSTTFKNKKMVVGIEADNCFYIKNEALIRNKDRLDLTKDPPPDLAIEIDVTSHTNIEIYSYLGVPEIWILEGGTLNINLLKKGKYEASETSEIFGQLSIKKELPKFLIQAKKIGRNKTIKNLRNWIRDSKDIINQIYKKKDAK